MLLLLHYTANAFNGSVIGNRSVPVSLLSTTDLVYDSFKLESVISKFMEHFQIQKLQVVLYLENKPLSSNKT